MALTDNERLKKKTKPPRSIAAGTNRSWGDKQKIEAVQSYLTLGNLALTSRILGIPEITLRVWKRSVWWNDLVNEIKSQEKMEMSSRLKKIVDASLSAVEDRIINGDLVFDQKSGQMVRKQVNLRDAHKVAVDLMDKREVLEKTTKEGPAQEAETDKLEQLAEKFAAFVTKKIENKPDLPVVEDITDVTPKEQ